MTTCAPTPLLHPFLLRGRRKVQIYKRFTDRRRSDLEEEGMMRMLAATGANVPENSGRRAGGVGSGWKRSSSLPAASTRWVFRPPATTASCLYGRYVEAMLRP